MSLVVSDIHICSFYFLSEPLDEFLTIKIKKYWVIRVQRDRKRKIWARSWFVFFYEVFCLVIDFTNHDRVSKHWMFVDSL